MKKCERERASTFRETIPDIISIHKILQPTRTRAHFTKLIFAVISVYELSSRASLYRSVYSRIAIFYRIKMK